MFSEKIKNYQMQVKKAFTLIELVGVIFVLVLLTTLIFTSVLPMRKKARDTQRIDGIKNLQTALNLFKQENGFYPEFATSGKPLIGPNGKTYLAKIPANVKSGSCVNNFGYNLKQKIGVGANNPVITNNLSYRIGYCLETKLDKFGPGQCYATAGNLCCMPSCDGKTCGDDGCGGLCNNDNCIAVCGTPSKESFDRPCNWDKPLSVSIGCKCSGGYVFDVASRLIVAPEDVSSSATWGCNVNNIAQDTVFGAGYKNTHNLVDSCVTAGAAARLCFAANLNTYKDWFLPSRDTWYLPTMQSGFMKSLFWRRHLFNIPGIVSSYWTSSEDSTDFTKAYKISLRYQDLPNVDLQLKSDAARVRCVRSDSPQPSFIDFAVASVNKSNVCSNETIQLSVDLKHGNLNPEDRLVWYRGGCGVYKPFVFSVDFPLEKIGIGTSISFSPGAVFNYYDSPEIYFVRVEDTNGNAKTGCVNTVAVNVQCDIGSCGGCISGKKCVSSACVNNISECSANVCGNGSGLNCDTPDSSLTLNNSNASAYEAQTTYKAVKVCNSGGTNCQCWMDKNINIGNMINNSSNDMPGINPISSGIKKYCYGNTESSYCSTEGGLYTWAMAMYLPGVYNYNSSYSYADAGLTSKRQGICPVGWHIPSDREWFILEKNLDDSVAAVTNTKSTQCGNRNFGYVADLTCNDYSWDYSNGQLYGIDCGKKLKSTLLFPLAGNIPSYNALRTQRGRVWHSTQFSRSVGGSGGGISTVLFSTSDKVATDFPAREIAASVRCLKD